VLRWLDPLALHGNFTTHRDLIIRCWTRGLEEHPAHAAADMVGRPLFDAIPDLDGRGFAVYYESALAGQLKVLAHGLHRYIVPVVDREERDVRQSGRITPLEIGNSIVGTITVIEDVTERVMNERELRTQIEASDHARGLAEEALRVKDEFLTTLSHEIRTPLNAVIGWARILMSRPVDAAMLARALEVIDRNATAQVRLIDDMLDTARIMSGKLRLETAPVDLSRVALAAIDVVSPTAQAKNVQLIAAFEPEGLMMLGDADRLQQIVWNLLANGVKFTEPGGSVTVSIARDQGFLVLSVQDTGEGIPADFMPVIFERFRQADPSASRRHAGLGIGLSLVRQLVELHGGRIRVSSVHGTGTTFTVTFPSRPDLIAGAVQVASGDVRLANVRVLVVDDQPEGRDMLTVALEQQGADVRAVSSVVEALAAIDGASRLELPQVIVCDVRDSGEPGLALIAGLNARSIERGAIPTIAVATYDQPRVRKRVLAAGFHKHLAKPFSPDDLAAAVRSLVRR
jgi:signal transduction histidine kinase/ActR/RegA family two-component response regulator